jgi:hypothetical protein
MTEQLSASEPNGTFTCDICGRCEPHAHDPKEVEIERHARPAFEKYLEQWLGEFIPTKKLWRGQLLGIECWQHRQLWVRNPGRESPNYADPMIEALWNFWLDSWVTKQNWCSTFDQSENNPAVTRPGPNPPAARMNWQPIETFPKDEDDFFATDDRVSGGFTQVVYWNPDTGRLHVPDAQISYAWGFFTHWMPRPATLSEVTRPDGCQEGK